jgi:hypothetical protein
VEGFEGLLDSFCTTTTQVVLPQSQLHALPVFRLWLATKLGDDLLGIEEFEEGSGIALEPKISDEYKASRVTEIHESKEKRQS